MPDLDHLEHFRVFSLDDVIPLITTEFRVFHFAHSPKHKSSKPAMYGRMWKIRAMGIDAMVREYEGEFVLITRREPA